MAMTLAPSQVPTASITPSLTTITTRPVELKARQVDTICGYASLDGVTYSLSCPVNVPCVTYTETEPALAFCSNPGAIPITTAIAYGFWPDYECAITPLAGYMCCGDALPNPGYFYWDSGSTIGAACMPAGISSITAVKALDADPTDPDSSPTTTTQPPSTTTSSHDATPTTGGSNGGSSGLSRAAEIGTIVGAVIGFCSLVAAVVFFVLTYRRRYGYGDAPDTTWTKAARNTSTRIVGCCISSRAGDDRSRNTVTAHGGHVESHQRLHQQQHNQNIRNGGSNHHYGYPRTNSGGGYHGYNPLPNGYQPPPQYGHEMGGYRY